MQGQSLVRPKRMGGQVTAIAGIADDRVPRLGQVNSDLIATPGFQVDFDQRCMLLIHCQAAIVRNGQFTIMFLGTGVAIQVVVGGQEASDRTRLHRKLPVN